MSNEFTREDHIVFKISDVVEHLTTTEALHLARLYEIQRVGRKEAGKAELECVVVESDWPEYEPTWQAIEARTPGAQPAPEAVAYLDLGVGGYVDIGTDLTDEKLATLPKGRHMLGIVGTYRVEGYSPAQPAPIVPDGWKLVPIEPTPEMLRALIDGANQYDSWHEGYRDMLAAAPEAKP